MDHPIEENIEIEAMDDPIKQNIENEAMDDQLETYADNADEAMNVKAEAMFEKCLSLLEHKSDRQLVIEPAPPQPQPEVKKNKRKKLMVDSKNIPARITRSKVVNPARNTRSKKKL
jgi:hypothetical protein